MPREHAKNPLLTRSIRLDQDTIDRIERRAIFNDRTWSQEVRHALKHHAMHGAIVHRPPSVDLSAGRRAA